ncbi:unnamed protein product [Rotaria sordida]|uniref:Uncharacterized protein n=1 Tax=Rotaria sordida TaxID=392033 RepID=A0A814TM40_9BILA|nr:unnamed protein product [Rotaria sordida]CAF1299290.1 unnamed protein product [Rotaria sordida]CAF3699206.1 unnamed protein product [Rotaria sordida]CAF3751387.1 unnamed protein product [Rotaria sordida]
MSTQQHNADSSLNNLPERNASKLTSSGASFGSTDVTGSGTGKGGSIPTYTNETSTQEKAPIDKHGDTWGGGIPGHNQEFK